jgi:hypothetical protein
MAQARQVTRTMPLTSDTNRPFRNQPTHEEVEPAWMDDNEAFGGSDPAIASVPDDLVHFTPGIDMIAAHRKDRNDGQWRDGAKPLVSFFGAEPPTSPIKPVKAFNAADYLLPERASDEPQAVVEPPSTGFSSRFQKFFGGPPQPAARAYQSPPNIPSPDAPALESRGPERVDDHMARLMGLLSAKVCLASNPVDDSPLLAPNLDINRHRSTHQISLRYSSRKITTLTRPIRQLRPMPYGY